MYLPVHDYHNKIMACLDDSFSLLSKNPHFERDWQEWRTVSGTKTKLRQAPILGAGSGGRHLSGFQKFAEKYFPIAENGYTPPISFERYHDFVLYSSDDWWTGKRFPLVIVESETKSEELFGELSGLISTRSIFKYLFIHPDRTFEKLKEYERDASEFLFDWKGTRYFVIDIPENPILPSKWPCYRASVEQDRGRIEFEQFMMTA